MNKAIQVGLSILFMLCILKLPYAYYEILRFLAMVCFSWLAYWENKSDNTGMFWFWAISAVFINPFIKLSLGRQLWMLIDVVYSLILIGDVVWKIKHNK